MLRRQQRQLKPTLPEAPGEEENAAEPTPPQAVQSFAQHNPIQSVELQKRKRSQSAAAAEPASSSRSSKNFKSLKSDKSNGRKRRIQPERSY
ncbi:hypothetical protein AWZ03_006589 [Drosophila navojoa]|uniref:Uncharacterized protein n=1 Tax=Drosophila navojoa TaxID=7232 RepID=A0A484BE56_DRONA|nr:hypothetical protein AWZ03_006589 [Drosophila navojoa]